MGIITSHWQRCELKHHIDRDVNKNIYSYCQSMETEHYISTDMNDRDVNMRYKKNMWYIGRDVKMIHATIKILKGIDTHT